MMDMGYIDFHRLYTLFHQARAFFVTRAKDNFRCEVISEAEVDKETGLISDKIVRLTTYKSAKSYPKEIRLVVYEDYANNTVYSFMTNDFDLPALSMQNSIGKDGRSSPSSNGLNNTCISRRFTGPAQTRSTAKFGLQYPPTC
jgi:hypothetical protein